MLEQQTNPGLGLIKTFSTRARSTDDMSDLDDIVTNADILGWDQPVNYVAEDLCLAISLPQEDIPHYLMVLYARFMYMGWIEKYGGECIFMSELIRRILRIHGFPAVFKEYKRTYAKKDRGWYMTTGFEDPDHIVPVTSIATHAVCVSDGYILDWAAIDNIHRNFGALSPWAFIGKDNSDWQELKIHGEIRWQPRFSHRLVKNEKFIARQEIIDCTRQYFRRYQI